MSGKRDSFLSLPTKKWKNRLGFGIDDDEIQAKVLEATPDDNCINDLSRFSEVVRLTSSGSEKSLKTLNAVHRVIISDEWNVAFKGLQLLNYLLHYSHEEVLPWLRENLRSLEEFARDLDDKHHKRVLQEQLRAVRLILEDIGQLEKEREGPMHDEWLYRVTRPPPARPDTEQILNNSGPGLPNLTPAQIPATRVSPSGSLSSSTTPLKPARQNKPFPISWHVGMSIEEGRRRQNQGGMSKAVASATANRGDNLSTHRKSLPIKISDAIRDGSREIHHQMVTVLTLQAIHMLLACQSIIEFLEANGDKMLFSRERDTELWKVYLNGVSTRGTGNMNRYQGELTQYLWYIENDPSEKLKRLVSSILEKAINEMQDLSLSLENFVKSKGVCIFADDALGRASHRIFSQPGKEEFDFVDEWEAQIGEIAARKLESIMGDMNEAAERDLQFRRTHLNLALQMKQIAAQFVDFAWKSGFGSRVEFEEPYTPKPVRSLTTTPTEASRDEPEYEPNLTFLTAFQDSEYKSRFVALAEDDSHVVSREKATADIQRLNIHPRSVAHIWEAVGDVTSSDELYFPEFALAMYLGNELHEGRSILLNLPPAIKKNVEHHVRLVKANIALNISNTWAMKYKQKTELFQRPSSDTPATYVVPYETDDGQQSNNHASGVDNQKQTVSQDSVAPVEVVQYRQAESLSVKVVRPVDGSAKPNENNLRKDDKMHKEGPQDEEVDRPSATQLSKDAKFEVTQVLVSETKGVGEDRENGLGRNISEIESLESRNHAMTEGSHGYISNAEISQITAWGVPSTPIRRNSAEETLRMGNKKTEFSQVESQIVIDGPQGESLEGDGGTKYINPSLTKSTWIDVSVRGRDTESETEGETREHYGDEQNSDKPAHNDPNDRDGALLKINEIKRRQEAEEERQVEAKRHIESEELFVAEEEGEAEEQRQLEEEGEEGRFEAAAEAGLEFEELFVAKEEAEAEEQRQHDESKQKQDTKIQQHQEAKSEDKDGCAGSTRQKLLDNAKNLVMPGEETERCTAATTFEEEEPQPADISPQSERLRTLEGQEEYNSRQQSLTRAGEHPMSLMGDGTAGGTHMLEHRQMDVLDPNDGYQTSPAQLRMQRQHAPNPDISGISSSQIISDLVRDSKLETAFAPTGQAVRHVSYAINPGMRRRRVLKEEIWERQSELGSGAFGRVWLEKCITGDDIGKLRAVKEITKLRRQSRSSEVDYNRELEAIAKFSHKKYVHCFVQSFGWYESEDAIFIAMEYLKHGDLQSHLDRPFPEDEVRDIVHQLLEGLSFMHENGFAHRDLKPANILVSERSPNWWVKISDFGISKRAKEESTAFRTLVGTRGYIAPEVIGIYCPEVIATIPDSSNLYTMAVDLWALGAIMFKLLTQETIFAEPLELARYVTAKRPFPRALVSEKGASEACMRFLEQAMAHSPTSRLSSSQALAHEWLADLSNLVDLAEEFPDRISNSIGFSAGASTGPLTPVAGDSTASAAWPSAFL